MSRRGRGFLAFMFDAPKRTEYGGPQWRDGFYLGNLFGFLIGGLVVIGVAWWWTR